MRRLHLGKQRGDGGQIRSTTHTVLKMVEAASPLGKKLSRCCTR